MNKQLIISDYDRSRDLSAALTSSSLRLYHPGLRHLLEMCLHSHDDLLWTEFISRTRPFIAGVVTKSVRRWKIASSSLVDDLVQETYLKLCTDDFKSLREFKYGHENALYGFLKVVASHVVHDYFRGSHSQKRGNGREEENLDQVSMNVAACRTSVQDVYRGVLLDEINNCLDDRASEPNFSRDYTIFWLYYRDGFTAKAIAALPSIGLTVKGVESTLLRLTRTVRAQLTGQASSVMNN